MINPIGTPKRYAVVVKSQQMSCWAPEFQGLGDHEGDPSRECGLVNCPCAICQQSLRSLAALQKPLFSFPFLIRLRFRIQGSGELMCCCDSKGLQRQMDSETSKVYGSSG